MGTSRLLASFPPNRNMQTSARKSPGVCASALTSPKRLKLEATPSAAAVQHVLRTKSLRVCLMNPPRRGAFLVLDLILRRRCDQINRRFGSSQILIRTARNRVDRRQNAGARRRGKRSVKQQRIERIHELVHVGSRQSR